ncbi:MAG TPA: SH3 domain-containing protein, partial [Aggregatilineales bacterium]|nr:SH3 domain-containing protein [Aggregatilineales bacterium]
MERKITRNIVFLTACFLIFGGLNLTFAQESSQIADVIQQAVDACADIGLDQACFGAGAVKTDGAEALNAAGDLVSLEGLRVLQTTADDWGISLARIPVREDSGDALTMVLLGDAEVTNNYDPASKTPTCTVTNLNAGGLNVHIGPDAELNVIAILDSQQKVIASGRNEPSDWYRVQIGESLGWVESVNAAIDCEAVTLNVVNVDDVSVLYEAPMQQITLVTGSDANAEQVSGLLLESPLDEVGRILVNNVQLEISGAAFLSASADTLRITGLLGSIDVKALGESITLRY